MARFGGDVFLIATLRQSGLFLRFMIHNIQALRALAAMLVVLVHLNPLLPWPAPDWGVDLFFVLSGFIMVIAATPLGPALFAGKRIARIVPLYWLVTLFTVVCAVVLPTYFQNTTANLADITRSLLFIPFTKDGLELRPILYVGWTLNYEMFFYALFAVGLALRRPVIFSTISIVALVSIGIFVPLGTMASFYTSPLLLQFAFGMLIGVVYLRRALVLWQAAILAICAITLLSIGHAFPAHRAFSYGLPAAALIYAAASLEAHGWRQRGLSALGDASYALYLTHAFIAGAALSISAFVPAYLLVPGAVIASCLVALLTYRFVERPLNQIAWLEFARKLSPRTGMPA